jgi:hypothetical protein
VVDDFSFSIPIKRKTRNKQKRRELLCHPQEIGDEAGENKILQKLPLVGQCGGLFVVSLSVSLKMFERTCENS